MKVSTKGDYGLRALIDLAQRYGEGAVQAADIARRQHIPEPYLDQLLTVLRRAGFITSRRGPQGGHALSRSPESINMSEALLALEGSLAPVGCLEETSTCSRLPSCAQREVYETIMKATQQVLEQTTIAELARRQSRRELQGAYHI